MSNTGNINVYFGKKEPLDRAAVWIKPYNGTFQIFAFLNGWKEYEAVGLGSSTGNVICSVSYTTSDADGNSGDYICLVQSTDSGYETTYVDLAEITREIKERLAQAEADIDALEVRMDTAESDIDSLEGRMDTAEADIDTAQADIDSLEERMTSAESGVSNLETRMDTAETDIDNLGKTTTSGLAASQEYDSDAQTLTLYAQDGTVLSSVDTSDFLTVWTETE